MFFTLHCIIIIGLCNYVTINISFININSVVQKGSFVIDLINDHSLVALTICETKIQDDPPAIKRDCTERFQRSSSTPTWCHGALCFIYRCNLLLVKRHRLQRVLKYNTVEYQLLTMNAVRDYSTSGNSVAIVYRPPSTNEADFLDELSSRHTG